MSVSVSFNSDGIYKHLCMLRECNNLKNDYAVPYKRKILALTTWCLPLIHFIILKDTPAEYPMSEKSSSGNIQLSKTAEDYPSSSVADHSLSGNKDGKKECFHHSVGCSSEGVLEHPQYDHSFLGTGLVLASLTLSYRTPALLPSHGDDQNIPLRFWKSCWQEEYCLQWETTDPKSSHQTQKQNQNNGEGCRRFFIQLKGYR